MFILLFYLFIYFASGLSTGHLSIIIKKEMTGVANARKAHSSHRFNNPIKFSAW